MANDLTAERWQKIKALFHAALERAATERAAFLDEACIGDGALRNEVATLIAAHEQPDPFIDGGAFEVAADLFAAGELPSAIGRVIGPYKIISQVGRGGMGEVYLAQDTRLGRRVALKLLPSRFMSEADRLRRFKQEARAASALNHPNIITIHEVGQVDNAHFIATEFVEGRTLRAMIESGRMRLDEALNVVIQVASALRSAHEAGIVHRDIKPENIMVRNDGYVKVLDFGLAKLTQHGQGSGSKQQEQVQANPSDLSTKTGVVMGTIKYMSPEQARGEKVDHRTDIFSLGVVLYEAITGRAPFEGETASHTIVAILEQEPKPIAEDVPEASAELQSIIDNALRKKREDRYQTISEMLDEVREVREEATFRARQERHSGPVGEVAPTGAVVAAQSHPFQGRNRTVLWAAMLAVAASALAFGVYEYTRARRALPSPSEARPTPFSQSVKMSRITAQGKVWGAAITREGKHIAYVAGPQRQQGLWVMQPSTASHAQIIPPADEVVYWGLTFSNDGDYIYYVRNVGSGPWELYRVSTLGGTPKKLLVNIDSAVTFSPDGGRMAFGRLLLNEGESRLVVANADGTGERVIATRKLPRFFGFAGLTKISWSPDGESIACPAGNNEFPGELKCELVAVSLKDGMEKPLTQQKWLDLRQVAWLGDGSGLVMVARDQPSSIAQVWHLSYPEGSTRRLTNDFSDYSDICVTADSGSLVTIQADRLSTIWVAPDGNAARARQITDSRNDGLYGISWTPDGRLVFGAKVGGNNTDIWIIDADGGNRQRLTDNADWDGYPSVSRAGRYVVFESRRADGLQIWRMDIDGSNPVQLTAGNGVSRPDCSPDGRWVYYSAMDYGEDPPFAWKVPIEGGAPVQLTDKSAYKLSVSPDQKFLAYHYWNLEANPPFGVAVVPVEGGPPIKLFNISHESKVFRWTPDGRALAYLDPRSLNVWAQPLDGGRPVQLTDFKTDQTFYFAWSRDGKQLALARGTVTSDVVLIRDDR